LEGVKVKRKPKVSGSIHSHHESCQNPWNGTCGNTEIVLYIYYEGERLPICRECWKGIADHDLEWGNEPEYPERLKDGNSCCR